MYRSVHPSVRLFYFGPTTPVIFSSNMLFALNPYVGSAAIRHEITGIAPAQRAQLLGDLIDEVDLLQVIGR